MSKVGFVVSPGFQMMSFAALSAFEIANVVAGATVYEIEIISEGGGLVRSSLGLSVETRAFDATDYDTLILGGPLRPGPASPGLLAFVRAASTRCRRIASICTGAFILAEAGLLNGRRATTHWHFARKLQSSFPDIKVEEDRIFLTDGPIWTSAGMSAGTDLALGMIEMDLGRAVALDVARNLVLYHRRSGGQSQHSTLLELDAKTDRIQSVLDYPRRNLRSALTVEQLAGIARLSPRQFGRVFRAETGQSPARAIERLRVETAKLMMEESRHPVDTVAAEAGFADRERMRRAFLRTIGEPPQAIRLKAKRKAVPVE